MTHVILPIILWLRYNYSEKVCNLPKDTQSQTRYDSQPVKLTLYYNYSSQNWISGIIKYLWVNCYFTCSKVHKHHKWKTVSTWASENSKVILSKERSCLGYSSHYYWQLSKIKCSDSPNRKIQQSDFSNMMRTIGYVYKKESHSYSGRK